MANISGLDFVALQVRDMEASRRFYTQQLGLVPAPGSPPHAVVFNTQPIPFAIRTPSVDLDASPRLGWGVAVWLKADDSEALCAALEANGVKIVQRPFDGPFGRTFSFADLDGYIITVHDR